MARKTLRILTFKGVQSKVKLSIEIFLTKEWKLFQAGAGERLLTGRLAWAFKNVFRGWDVDAEYNRFGQSSKRSPIPSRVRSRHKRGHLVTPDIIVHKRLKPTGQNLLAIEAKTAGKAKGIVKDREKLASYLGWPLFYRYVALVVFSSTEHPWCSFELFSREEDPKQPKKSLRLTLKRKR